MKHTHILLVLVSILLTVGSSVAAQDEGTLGLIVSADQSVNEGDMAADNISIPPSSPLYSIKLALQDLQEFITINELKKAELRQKHLEERLQELAYDIKFSNSTNIAKVLEKIQNKQNQTQESIDRLTEKLNCIQGVNCTQEDSDKKTMHDYYETKRNQSVEVLTRLLNDPRMPEQSRKGLMNALNSSGHIKVKIEDDGKVEVETKRYGTIVGGAKKDTEDNKLECEDQEDQLLTASCVTPDDKEHLKVEANMSMNYYSEYASAIPFKRIMIYSQIEQKWYSAVVLKDKVTITDESSITNPEFYVYPTDKQIIELKELISKVNSTGGLKWYDKGRLFSLWYNMKKTAGVQ